MITIHSDGSSLGNPGPTGWGIILASGEGDDAWEAEYYGGFKTGTNNIGELSAVIEGLKLLQNGNEPIHIRTDSKYVIEGVTKWMQGWIARGWKTAAKKPVANKELWLEYLDLAKGKSITFEWVKGHSKDHFNERCDALAKRGARENS